MAIPFESIEDVKAVFSAPNINNEFSTIQTYIEDAVPVITQFIGIAYDALVEAPENTYYLNITPQVKRALINLAYYSYAKDGSMQINDSGFHRTEDENNKSAYRWQVETFKEQRLSVAWSAISEMLILFNRDAILSEWKDTDERKDTMKYLIWNVNLFRSYRSVDSFRTVYQLRNSMLHVQEEIIASNIGSEFYQELLTQNLSRQISDNNKKILPFIYKAIAHLSVARGIDEGLLSTGEDGICLKNSVTREGKVEIQAELDRIQFVKTEAEKKGQAAIAELRTYLNQNSSATVYPLYFNNKDLYDDPNDLIEKSTFRNESTSPTFGFF